MSNEPTLDQQIQIAKAKVGIFSSFMQMSIIMLALIGLPRACSRSEIEASIQKGALSDTLMKAATAQDWKNGAVINLEDVRKESEPLYQQRSSEANRSFATSMLIFGVAGFLCHMRRNHHQNVLAELESQRGGPSPS